MKTAATTLLLFLLPLALACSRPPQHEPPPKDEPPIIKEDLKRQPPPANDQPPGTTKDGQKIDDKKPAVSSGSEQGTLPVENVQKKEDKDSAPAANKDQAAFIQANHRLTTLLYAQLNTPDDNMLVAPAEVLTILAALVLSEENNAQAEIRKALALEIGDLNAVHLKKTLLELAEHRKSFNDPESFFLGLQIAEKNGEVRVKAVHPSSAAGRAGFQVGERIVSVRATDEVDDHKITSAADFSNILDEGYAALRVKCSSDSGDVVRTLYLAGAKNVVKHQPQMVAARAVWFQQGNEPSSLLDELDGQAVEALKADTKTDLKESAKRILNWFDKKLLSNEVLPRVALTPDLKTCFLDSVIFKPGWSSAVVRGAAVEMPFSAPGRKKSVSGIPFTGRMRLAKTGQMLQVEVPLRGGLALAFFLPNDDRAAFEKKMPPNWLESLDSAVPQEMTVTVPEMQLFASNDLRKPLANIGMEKLFAPPAKPAPDKDAPLKKETSSGADKKDAKKESGDKKNGPAKEDAPRKKAASSTIIQQIQMRIKAREGDAPAQSPAEALMHISLDRPFIFVVFDRRTKEILILGRFADPWGG